jgi:esterase/lipase
MKSFLISRFFGLQTLSPISSRKLFLSNILVFLTLSSCKTIEIPEKWVFKETKYNYEKVVDDITKNNYSPAKKDSILKIYNTIINTDEQLISATDGISVWRRFLKKDTLNLEYFVFEPQKTKKAGLFFIGNTSSIPGFRNELMALAKQTDSKIYVLNYRGYGKTNGIPSFKTQFTDNKLFLDEIIRIENKVDFVIGYSLGSVFATQLAVENTIPDLYLLSPFSNTKTILAYQKKVFTKGPKMVFRPFIKLKTEEHLTAISNTEKIKNFKGNLVIIHGTDDEVLPFTMGQNLYKNALTSSKKMYPLKEGKHNAPFKKDNWALLINEIKI